eukprot:gene21845-biopygen13231
MYSIYLFVFTSGRLGGLHSHTPCICTGRGTGLVFFGCAHGNAGGKRWHSPGMPFAVRPNAAASRRADAFGLEPAAEAGGGGGQWARSAPAVTRRYCFCGGGDGKGVARVACAARTRRCERTLGQVPAGRPTERGGTALPRPCPRPGPRPFLGILSYVARARPVSAFVLPSVPCPTGTPEPHTHTRLRGRARAGGGGGGGGGSCTAPTGPPPRGLGVWHQRAGGGSAAGQSAAPTLTRAALCGCDFGSNGSGEGGGMTPPPPLPNVVPGRPALGHKWEPGWSGQPEAIRKSRQDEDVDGKNNQPIIPTPGIAAAAFLASG